MEKRATRRHTINTSIVCSCLNSVNFAEPIDGIMKNCCYNGLYAELQSHFKKGSVMVVRTTGSSCGFSSEDGFCSLAVAEGKWAKPKSVKGQACCATGLRYLTI